MLSIKSLLKEYPMQGKPTKVLDGLDLEIERGKQVCIVGPSGCGKSTLLHLIAGLESSDGGEILIDGKDILRFSEKESALFRRKNVGFVFQNYNLLEDFSVFENLLIAGRLSGMDLVSLKKRAEELLFSLGLESKKDSRVTDLSGGEAQRVAIARARMNAPSLLLADEATGNIDETMSKKILEEMISHNKKERVTMLFVTHNSHLIPYFDACYEMEAGKIKKS